MGLTGAKPFKTPLEVKVKLTTLEFDQHVDSDALLDDPGEYQRMVGRLLYLTIIRPDIAFVVQRPSQFMRSSKMSHMHATVRVFKYIKTSTGLGVFMPASSSPHLTAYSDADWAACPNNRLY